MCVFPQEALSKVVQDHEAEALARFNGIEIIPDSAKLILPGDANSHDSNEMPIVSPDADTLMRFANRAPHGVVGSFQDLALAV